MLARQAPTSAVAVHSANGLAMCCAVAAVHATVRHNSLWRYFALFVLHPRRTWIVLLADADRLRYGFEAVLTVGAGYALTVVGIAASGGVPSTPWLNIPAAEYFKWEAVFILPVTLLCWVLSAGVMHLIGKLFGAEAIFDDTLALVGFAVGLATCVSLIPDAIRALLTSAGLVNRAAWERAVNQPGTPDFVFLWAYMTAYLLALVWLFPMAVASSQHLRIWPAIVVGIAGAFVYQGVYFVFVR